MTKWRVERENDVFEGAFSEWWEVSDGSKVFRCDEEKDALWLADLLNKSSGNLVVYYG